MDACHAARCAGAIDAYNAGDCCGHAGLPHTMKFLDLLLVSLLSAGALAVPVDEQTALGINADAGRLAFADQLREQALETAHGVGKHVEDAWRKLGKTCAQWLAGYEGVSRSSGSSLRGNSSSTATRLVSVHGRRLCVLIWL